jgi:hypothetical protein
MRNPKNTEHQLRLWPTSERKTEEKKRKKYAFFLSQDSGWHIGPERNEMDMLGRKKASSFKDLIIPSVSSASMALGKPAFLRGRLSTRRFTCLNLKFPKGGDNSIFQHKGTFYCFG